MPTTIAVGETVNFTAQFLEYDELTGEEIIIDPDSVAGSIYKLNATADEYELFDSFTPTEPEPAFFSYDWVTTAAGNFKVNFVATFGAIQVTNTRYVFIGPIDVVHSLENNEIHYFLAGLDPLYLDPDFVLRFYPDGDLVEIAELIHWYSNELLSILNVNAITEVTPLMQDFILASILCDLSRIYTFSGGLSGFTSSESFTLGDLSVKTGSSTSQGSGGQGRGGASTWCELAAYLRDQLTMSKTGGRAYVRGAIFNNYVPSRHLKRVD